MVHLSVYKVMEIYWSDWIGFSSGCAYIC